LTSAHGAPVLLSVLWVGGIVPVHSLGGSYISPDHWLLVCELIPNNPVLNLGSNLTLLQTTQPFCPFERDGVAVHACVLILIHLERGERRVSGAARQPSQVVVHHELAERHLDAHLDGGRAVVAVEDARRPLAPHAAEQQLRRRGESRPRFGSTQKQSFLGWDLIKPVGNFALGFTNP
jgi:hypothetical protein